MVSFTLVVSAALLARGANAVLYPGTSNLNHSCVLRECNPASCRSLAQY